MGNDVSPNVDMFDLDYKKDRQTYTYLTTMRIEVISFAFHPICILNFNRLWALVRVLVYVSFPFVRSDYVISAGVGFRVASGVVASP